MVERPPERAAGATWETWCFHRFIDPDCPSAADIILAHTTDVSATWQENSKRTFLGNVTRLLTFERRCAIQSHPDYIRFHRLSKAGEIHQPVRNGTYDLSPAFAYIRTLGENDVLTNKQGTRVQNRLSPRFTVSGFYRST
ncbi:hypothetical protein BC940DRAFT_317569 [Gongronella butleri]|nr:hypothetical protein BC940DRAFT_317569 [Gongronella butleri]